MPRFHAASRALSVRARIVACRASHTFAVLSELPVTIRVPSGLNATLCTAPCGPQFEQRRAACPRVPHLRRCVRTAGDDPRPVGAERHAGHRCPCGPSVRAGSCPSAVPHLRCVVHASGDDARPSGLNATLLTAPVWPLRSSKAVPVGVPHLRRLVRTAGDDPRPSGLNATLITGPCGP